MRPAIRIILSAAVALGITTGTGASVRASHTAPFDGPRHLFGEMVDYSLVFPVVGDYWFQDWFWAPRPGGLHHGQDVFADKMTPVVAAAPGTILRVNGTDDPANPAPGRCCSIVLLHDDGWRSFYVHLNNDTPGTDDGLGWGIAPGITPGARVEAGDHIGWVGDSGNAEDTPPHLHFELRDPDGVAVNPYASLLAAEGIAACAVTRVGDVAALVGGSGRLGLGSQGAAVRQLQRILARLGHAPGRVDGIFGPLTDAAVRAFQLDRGIVVDGLVGGQTRGEVGRVTRLSDEASLVGTGGRLLVDGARGSDVRALQVMLAAAGHDPGPIDGVFGSLTAASVRSFQTSAAIVVDGLVGAETRGALTDRLGLGALVACR